MYNTTRIAIFFAVLVCLALPSRADDTPAGMVAFFSGAGCPSGWAVATAAQGRLIVGTTDGAHQGLTVADPMKDATPPTHTHVFKPAYISVPERPIAGISGCCNNTAARAGGLSTPEGTTTASDAALPFVQLTVCRKN